MPESRDIVFLHGSYRNRNFGDYVLIRRLANEISQCGFLAVLPFASKKVMSEFSDDVRKGRITDFFRAKMAVWGGGGYFGEPRDRKLKWTLNFFRRHFVLYIFCRLFRIPYIIVGAGAGPASSCFQRWMIRAIFTRAETLALRDDESVNFANEILGFGKAVLATDLAQDLGFLKSLALENEAVLPKFERYIFVHTGAGLSAEKKSVLIDRFDDYLRNGGSILFGADSPGYNIKLMNGTFDFNELAARYPGQCDIATYESPGKLISYLMRAEGVVTEKLHVGIVAATLGSCILSVPLHGKTKRYYRHIGYPELCYDNNEIFQDFSDRFFNGLSGGFSVSIPADVSERHELALDILRHSLSRVA